jgi:hypothetical protein
MISKAAGLAQAGLTLAHMFLLSGADSAHLHTCNVTQLWNQPTLEAVESRLQQVVMRRSLEGEVMSWRPVQAQATFHCVVSILASNTLAFAVQQAGFRKLWDHCTATKACLPGQEEEVRRPQIPVAEEMSLKPVQAQATFVPGGGVTPCWPKTKPHHYRSICSHGCHAMMNTPLDSKCYEGFRALLFGAWHPCKDP